MTELKQQTSSELDPRKGVKDFYALRFWIDNFPSSDLQADEETAEQMVQAVPLWKMFMKQKRTPNFGFHPDVVDSMDIQYLTNFAKRYSEEVNVPVAHGAANLDRERQYWQVREQLGNMVQQKLVENPPAASK